MSYVMDVINYILNLGPSVMMPIIIDGDGFEFDAKRPRQDCVTGFMVRYLP